MAAGGDQPWDCWVVMAVGMEEVGYICRFCGMESP